MTSETSPENLRTFYADPSLLGARQQTYAAANFVGWVLDRVSFDGVREVLDAGAGVGRFTVPVAGRVAGRVVATDLFPGMLRAIGSPVKRCVADIQALPFTAGRFDLVLANHVLYHLPDIDLGVRELARVTSPAGTLVATTNADDIPVAVVDLHVAAQQRLGVATEPAGPSAFSLRNGEEVLRRSYDQVRLHTFRAEQVFATAADLVAAHRTTGRFQAAAEQVDGDLGAAAADVAADWAARAGGSVTSPIVMGAFVCTGPRPD
ncbi:methyltransferase domain-containing protein [Actinoplanes sp. NPDC049265]|uniref:class I SAM-dependent methyltransferase n=1 Tax=Actinoplanes sp. NPDC049265 TaxID=3363902 RepID=UPI0037118A71